MTHNTMLPRTAGSGVKNKEGKMTKIQELMQQHETWRREIAKAFIDRLLNDPTVWDVEWDEDYTFDVTIDGVQMGFFPRNRNRYVASVVKVNLLWVAVDSDEFTPPQWVFDAKEGK